MYERSILWRALAWPGIEHLRLTTTARGSTADGLIVGADDDPFRLHYRVDVDLEWRFHRLQVFEPFAASGAPGSVIRQLTVDEAGSWFQEGFAYATDLRGCTEIDISATPFTNTLPIRRLNLDVGESSETDVAYLWVPTLELGRKPQRYTRLEPRDGLNRYRFESLDSDFVADVTVDDDGLLVDYPELFERI
jgi:hypothetical protein